MPPEPYQGFLRVSRESPKVAVLVWAFALVRWRLEKLFEACVCVCVVREHIIQQAAACSQCQAVQHDVVLATVESLGSILLEEGSAAAV